MHYMVTTWRDNDCFPLTPLVQTLVVPKLMEIVGLEVRGGGMEWGDIKIGSGGSKVVYYVFHPGSSIS